MQNTESLRAALRDIHGIDAVSWWPPAPGWWLVGAGVVVLAVLIRRGLGPRLWLMGLWCRAMAPAWQQDAATELRKLRRASARKPCAELAGELSALLRRIAMVSQGRESCAGLHGAAWLDWLAQQDPVGFDWRARGQALLRAPYAPPAASDPERSDLRAELTQLIAAAEAWVQPRAVPCSSRQGTTRGDALACRFGIGALSGWRGAGHD